MQDLSSRHEQHTGTYTYQILLTYKLYVLFKQFIYRRPRIKHWLSL